VVVAVFASYFPKDYTKENRKQHHICLPETKEIIYLFIKNKLKNIMLGTLIIEPGSRIKFK